MIGVRSSLTKHHAFSHVYALMLCVSVPHFAPTHTSFPHHKRRAAENLSFIFFVLKYFATWHIPHVLRCSDSIVSQEDAISNFLSNFGLTWIKFCYFPHRRQLPTKISILLITLDSDSAGVGSIFEKVQLTFALISQQLSMVENRDTH